MAVAEQPIGRESTLFLDARGAGRGLRVSWNADGRTVVLSLWEGERCRATCHLPVEDAARLISVLAADVGAALVGPPPAVPPAAPAAGPSSPWRRLEAALRRRLGPTGDRGATVLSFPPEGRRRRRH